MKLTTYLNFDGTSSEAFHNYEQHLGGRITLMLRDRFGVLWMIIRERTPMA